MDDDAELGFETLAIHAGQTPDLTTGAVVTPIFQTSTFSQSSVGEHQGYEYSRTGNPTRTALETCLAALEAATFGRAFSSGMSANDAVLRLLAPGRPRAHRERRLRRDVPPALAGARARRSPIRPDLSR